MNTLLKEERIKKLRYEAEGIFCDALWGYYKKDKPHYLHLSCCPHPFFRHGEFCVFSELDIETEGTLQNFINKKGLVDSIYYKARFYPEGENEVYVCCDFSKGEDFGSVYLDRLPFDYSEKKAIENKIKCDALNVLWARYQKIKNYPKVEKYIDSFLEAFEEK